MQAMPVVLERCPLCGAGPVEEQPRLLPWHARLARCRTCSGDFRRRSDGSYMYSYCNPDRIAAVRGLGKPSACSQCAPCQLGAARSLDAWREFAGRSWPRLGGGLSSPGQRAVYTAGAAAAVDLPWHQSLEGDRVLHVTFPSYLGEPAMGRGDREGYLAITDRHLAFLSRDRKWVVHLDQVSDVRATVPGLEVCIRGDPEPVLLAVPDDEQLLPVLKQTLGGTRPSSGGQHGPS